MKAKLLKLLFDAGVLAGLGIFLFGLHLVWQPLSWLVGGLLLAAASFFAGYDRLRSSTIERIRNGGRA